MKSVRYLHLEEALYLHDLVIEAHGGSTGLRDLGLLESALNSPQQAVFGEELYPDLPTKAAILLFLLVKNHPFVDGNKRTALTCCFRFLEINACTLDVSNEDLYTFTLSIATGDLDKDATTAWVRDHLRPLASD